MKRLKIMTNDGSISDDDVRGVLGELLRHPELNIDLGLSACRHLNSNGRYDLCDSGLKELLSRFTGSRHVGRVHAERLLAAIHRLPMEDAVDYTDKFFDENDTLLTLDEEPRKGIQLLLWEQAAKCHETGQLDLCLAWYDQSLRLFLFGKSLDEMKKDKEMTENVAKLHRNRTSCLLGLGRLAQAEEAAQSAIECNQNCIFSQFTYYKVAVAQGKQREAISAVSRLVDGSEEDGCALPSSGRCTDIKRTLICLAAQLALEKSQRDVALATLHHLANSKECDMANLTAFRCLIRLYLTMSENTSAPNIQDTEDPDEKMDEDSEPQQSPRNKEFYMKSAIASIKEAYHLLQRLSQSPNFTLKRKSTDSDQLVLPGEKSHVIDKEQFANEVTWFMKITWNLALQYNDNHNKMKELFLLCKELLDLVEADESVLLRQKTCLLMCAACGLAIARNSDKRSCNKDLEEVLDILEKCRVICSRLAAIQSQENSEKPDKSSVLLALYHFEALAKLKKFTHKGEPQELQDLFEEITNLPHVEVKTFETVAALAMEVPAHHPEICKLSIKTALKLLNHQLTLAKHETEKAEILKKRSGLYRMLIDTNLNQGSISDPAGKDECWSYFNEIYQIMQNESRTFPELDLLWLSIRSWNVGVHLFTASHVIEAEKWCALALRLLTQLERFKENYESHMNIVYQEILAKKDFSRNRMAVAK